MDGNGGERNEAEAVGEEHGDQVARKLGAAIRRRNDRVIRRVVVHEDDAFLHRLVVSCVQV